MPSAINPSVPADAIPAQKSQMRANFAAAKSEIEALQAVGGGSDSEGITYLTPFTGSVSRTVESKLYESVSLKDFGAALDGVTDDTAAWNKAIVWLAGSGGSGRVLRVIGNTVLNPASLTWKLINPDSSSTGANDISSSTIEVEGTLRVTSTLRLPAMVTLLGKSGAFGVQFAQGRSCEVLAGSGLTGPVMQLSGSPGLYNRLENVTVGGSPNGPNLRIGYSGTEPGHGTSGGQSYKVWLKNVGAYVQTSGQSAVEIFNCFWVWIRDFAFLADAGCYASVRIGGSHAPAAGDNSGGLVHFENGVFAGFGIVMDHTYAPGGGYESFFSFRNIHYETCRGPFLHMKRTGGGRVSQLLYENVEAADSTGANNALLYIDPVNATVVQSVFFRMCPAIYMAGLGGDLSKIMAVHWDGGGQTINEMGSTGIISLADPDKYPRGTVISYNGAVASQPAFAPSSLAPVYIPNGFVVATPNALNSVTIGTGTGTITTGQLAPDGTTTAILVNFTNTGDGITSVLGDTFVTLLNGDLLVFGAYIRYVAGAAAAPLLLANTNGGSGGFEGSGLSHAAGVGASMFGFSGWSCMWEVCRYTASGATQQAQLKVWVPQISVLTSPSSFKLWAPFLIRVPASAGWRRQDVVAWASNLIGPPQSGGAGVQAQLPGATFKTGRGATASRPTASAVGAGAQWFDTDLNWPTWSDGTNWATPVTLRERTITTADTIGAADHGKRIICTSAATHAVAAAATLGAGFECEVINDSGGNVILNGPGATDVTMASGEVVTLICANSKIRVAKGASTVIS